MAHRKHISLKTRLASALLALGDVPYDDAKRITADQLISLYQLDHNILYETEHPDRDLYWNLTPTLIEAHREKTKKDQGIIAKSRRIRRRRALAGMRRVFGEERTKEFIKKDAIQRRKELKENPILYMADAISAGWKEGCSSAFQRIIREEKKREIPQRVNPWPPRGSRKLQSGRSLKNASRRKSRHHP